MPLVSALLLVVGVLVAGGPAAADDPETIKLSVPLPEFGHVRSGEVAVSPDGTQVLYQADVTFDNVYELFVVPITGGESIRLHPPLTAEHEWGPVSATFTPDGRNVVYSFDSGGAGPNRRDLFIAPIDGSPPVRLNRDLADDEGVLSFSISPDGGRIVFDIIATIDDDLGSRWDHELWSVQPSGDDPVLLYETDGLEASLDRIAISPDATTVVFGELDETIDWPYGVPWPRAVYSVPITGGPAVPLCGDLAELGCGSEVITADSGYVVFRSANHYDDDHRHYYTADFYSVPLGGGDLVRLNPDPLDSAYWNISPDGKYLVYEVGSDRFHPADRLMSVPVTGGDDVLLTPLDFDYVYLNQITPDSAAVLFGTSDGVIHHDFVVPIRGGEIEALPIAGVTSRLYVAPDGSRLVYAGRTSPDATTESVFSLPLTGGPVTDLGVATQPDGYVVDVQIAPDSAAVLIHSSREGGNSVTTVPIGGGPMVKLPVDLPDRINGWEAIDPTSRIVLFVSDMDSGGPLELFATPLPQYRCRNRPAVIVGSPGDDTLVGTSLSDVILAGAGNDVVQGLSGDDTICGGAGDDRLRGNDGDDTIHGGAGNDLLRGNDGDDVLIGIRGDDLLAGGDGDDRLKGGWGADRLVGGDGNDRLRGGVGSDTLLGGAGDDHLIGHRDDDQLHGGPGDDVLLAGNGLDRINGGDGRDSCRQGEVNRRCEVTKRHDDFRSYEEGTYPTTGGWSVQWSGRDAAVVWLPDVHDGFRLSGSADLVRTDALTLQMPGVDILRYRVRVRCSSEGEGGAEVGFFERTAPNESWMFNSFHLENDGRVVVKGTGPRVGGPNEPYDGDTGMRWEFDRWHLLEARVDYESGRITFWFDGTKVGFVPQAAPRHASSIFALSTHSGADGVVYFDDVTLVLTAHD